MIAALLLMAATPIALAAPAAAVVQEDAPVEIWRVDQLRLPADTPKAKLKALEPDHSLDAVMRHLKALGIPFTRAQVGLVPSRMPERLRADLSKLPAGEPFVLPGDDYVTVNVITAKQLPPDVV